MVSVNAKLYSNSKPLPNANVVWLSPSPGTVLTVQTLSEDDHKFWIHAMGGKEPVSQPPQSHHLPQQLSFSSGSLHKSYHISQRSGIFVFISSFLNFFIYFIRLDAISTELFLEKEEVSFRLHPILHL